MKSLLIVPGKSGFMVFEVDTSQAERLVSAAEAQAFESLGGRYQTGGVIDAIRDHFEPRPALSEAA